MPLVLFYEETLQRGWNANQERRARPDRGGGGIWPSAGKAGNWKRPKPSNVVVSPLRVTITPS